MVKAISKPAVLYHGSTNRNIELFEPQARHFRDPKEGPVVFATSVKAVASFFMVEVSKMEGGRFDEVPYFVAEREEFLAKDRGGCIYLLPGETFVADEHKGMGEIEWISKKEVIPISKEEYESALETMLNLGVQVYLVEAAILEKLRQSTGEENRLILRNLPSENQNRAINSHKF